MAYTSTSFPFTNPYFTVLVTVHAVSFSLSAFIIVIYHIFFSQLSSQVQKITAYLHPHSRTTISS